MREFLASGKVGTIEYNTQKKLREDIQNRWESLGFTVGLKGHIKENIAMLYENTAKSMLFETTDSSNSGSFETVVFPIIRRVFSKLLANEIVSVQALNMPIGKLFFLKPVTSERTWDNGGDDLTDGSTASHKGMMGANLHDRNNNGADLTRPYLPGVTVTGDDITTYFKKSLYDLFYDDFLYDNSRGKININVGTAVPVFNNAGEFTTGTTQQTHALHADGSLRSIILKVTGFNSYNAGKLTGADGNEMDTEVFLASLKVVANTTITGTTSFTSGENVPYMIATQKYGKGIVERENVCDSTGAIYLVVDLTKPVNTSSTTDGYIGVGDGNVIGASTFKIAWAQYDSLELDTEIGEVGIQLDSVTVSVEARKLRATWSPEMAQDVAAFQNIDAEAELTAVLSQQIAAETDRSILKDLRVGAPWQLRFDVNGWKKQAGYSTNYTQKDWNQELFTKINQISAQIQKATLQGGANYIVVSSEISALFDNLEYFHVSDASAESDQYNMGIERIGSLNNRLQVFRDPYAPHYSMIIGHKGKSLLDTGYIYAPYIPATLTNVMTNVFNFGNVRGIMERSAKKMVNNKFYGHIRVDNLTTWPTSDFR